MAMNLTKSVKMVLAVGSIVFVAVVIYGLTTDCPDTSGYFFCSESERRFLQQ
jgi:hypothetical protein